MKKVTVLMMAFVLVFLAHAQLAHAQAVLTLNDGLGHSVSVTDNGSGDTNPLVGAIYWSGTLGNWTLAASLGQSQPLLVAPNLLDLNVSGTTSNSGSGSNTLTSTVSDSGFGPYNQPLALELSYGGTLDGTGSFTLLDNSTAIANFSLNAGAVHGSAIAYLPSLASTDVLELETVLTQGNNLSSTGDEKARVPEPSTLLLLGAALLTFAVVRTKLAKHGA
ncbi:MAG: PEP-CTERM sorting domain-containing protein [Nitrospiraceae bacterium]|nr:PEP-CTERM sorting domain-containing protein [Nitrospiraceae bacterium]